MTSNDADILMVIFAILAFITGLATGHSSGFRDGWKARKEWTGESQPEAKERGESK